MSDSRTYNVAWLPGDGVGREVTSAALDVVERLAPAFGFSLETQELAIGGNAIDAHGSPHPDATLRACREADAVLLGAVGGSKWDDLPADRRPEAGLLRIWKELAVFANPRPLVVPRSVASRSPVLSEIVAGADPLRVSDLPSGVPF